MRCKESYARWVVNGPGGALCHVLPSCCFIKVANLLQETETGGNRVTMHRKKLTFKTLEELEMDRDGEKLAGASVYRISGTILNHELRWILTGTV